MSSSNSVKRIIITALIVTLVVVIAVAIIVSYTLVKNNLEAEQLVLQAQLEQEIRLKQEALSNLENVISIRNAYRSNLREIVQLLYNRDTYLSVGGSDIQVEQSDEAILLEMHTVISSMNNDLQLMGQVNEYLQLRSDFINSFPFIWPVKGGVPNISSDYGFRYDPFGEREGIQYHAGIDIPGEMGTSIQSTAAGRVVALYDNYNIHGDYGVLVIIQHNYGFQTYYAHLDEVEVRWGETVERGQIIGYMGNTGKSTGTHLHYEIRHNSVPMNPMDYLLTNY